MMLGKFKISPLAIAREDAEGVEVRLAVTLEFEEVDGSPTVLANIEFSDHGRALPVREIVHQSAYEWVWLGGDGAVFTARAIRPSDAPLAGVYGYDLPQQVLAAVAYGQQENEIMLQAVVDEDDQRVLTLLLASDAGLFARYDTLWHPVTDPEVFAGSYVVDVHEDSLQIYDAADAVGGQVAAASLMVDKNSTSGEVPLPADVTPPSQQGLMAAAQIPVIEDEAQLKAAILAAGEDESIRWYVEKRAAALGAEVELPWKS